MTRTARAGSAAKIEGACLAKIRTHLRSRSKIAVRIAQFVLKSPAAVRDMSIYEMAVRCGASTATLSRFTRSLGYNGFKEFQLDLAAAVARDGETDLAEFGRRANPESIVHQVFEANRQSLTETERLVDKPVLIEVARRIRRSRRIFLLGIGGSAQVAREAAQRFLSLGLTALTLEDPYFQIFATENVAGGDVVIGISHTGQTASVIEGIEQARRRGAVTVALTNYPRSRLASASDFALITAYREHRVNAAVSSSRIAQMCLIDSLYFILGSWRGKPAQVLAEEAEQRTRKILRIRPPQRVAKQKGIA
jgi:DNA-binding MurR/RpiR family transcriptional regulator